MEELKMNQKKMKMYYKNIFILFCLMIFISETAYSQRAAVKTDTTHIYKNIEIYSKRSKFTRFMYGLIFIPQIQILNKRKTYRKLIQKPYIDFEGKIIRKINIETLDPFGHSIADTISQFSLLSKAGNKLHIKSQHITIRNLLLFHQNQRFDSLLVKESERLVRSNGFVSNVSFFVKLTSKKSDSVDIFIREIDNWSLIPKMIASTSSNTFLLTEENVFGLGHEYSNSFTRNISNGINAYSTNYIVPNIKNTYISTTLHYETDEYANFNKSLNIDRLFYSPLAKWAGGVSIKSINSVTTPLKYKYNAQDYWAGYATQVFKGNSLDERTTNLVLTTRYFHKHFLEMPTILEDPLAYFSDENFYLAGIGISTRKYVQDKYVFQYGITEDVPIGKVYGLTAGYQLKNGLNRLFLGARFSVGNYYSWGYLSSNLEYESFFLASIAQEGIFTANINYFTGLFEIGKWKFRQFIKPELTLGINRLSIDSLTLNDGYGLGGFKSTNLSGNSRFLLSIQTQAYSPLNLFGFRFGPFLTYTLGVLGHPETGFKNQRIFSQIGLGLLIKNENLIMNTFQFSFSFYPLMPGNGNNVFKTNSFKTTDYGFSNFEIGKPATKVFQ